MVVSQVSQGYTTLAKMMYYFQAFIYYFAYLIPFHKIYTVSQVLAYTVSQDLYRFTGFFCISF